MSQKKEYVRRNTLAFLVLASLAGEFIFRQSLRKVTELTPLQLAAYMAGVKAASEVVGLMASKHIDPEHGVDNWIKASNTMYNWYGLENTGYGAPLNLIPNPVGVGELLFESGKLLGEASLGVNYARPRS